MLIIIVAVVAFVAVSVSVVFFPQLLLFLLLCFGYFDFWHCQSKKLCGRLISREFSISNTLFTFLLCFT